MDSKSLDLVLKYMADNNEIPSFGIEFLLENLPRSFTKVELENIVLKLKVDGYIEYLGVRVVNDFFKPTDQGKIFINNGGYSKVEEEERKNKIDRVIANTSNISTIWKNFKYIIFLIILVVIYFILKLIN